MGNHKTQKIILNTDKDVVGLSIPVDKGGCVTIGNDIKVVVKMNNTFGSKNYSLLIVAPRDVDIWAYDRYGKRREKTNREGKGNEDGKQPND